MKFLSKHRVRYYKRNRRYVWTYDAVANRYEGICENSLNNLKLGPRKRQMEANALREKIIALRASGKTISEIVAEVRLGGSTVYRYLHGATKLPSRRKVAFGMFATGATLEQVIAATGLAPATAMVYRSGAHKSYGRPVKPRDPLLD